MRFSPVRLRHRIEIRLVDTEGDPVPQEEYLITLPDGSSARGYLDDEGWARLAPLQDGGTYKVSFPRLDGTAWSYDHSDGPKT